MAKPNDDTLYVTRRKVALTIAGLTQKDVADRWGCHKSMVSHLVLGISRSHDMEIDFAKLVGKSYSYLFTAGATIRKPGRKR